MTERDPRRQLEHQERARLPRHAEGVDDDARGANSGVVTLGAGVTADSPADRDADARRDDESRAQGDGKRISRRVLQLILVLVLLVLAGALVWFLFRQKTAPAKLKALPATATVETTVVSVGAHTVKIVGYGTVRAQRMLTLASRVRGEIVDLHDAFVAGGFLESGATVAAIERDDYQYAADQADAQVARVRAQLAQLDGRREQAEAELAAARRRLAELRAEAAVAIAQFRELYPEREVPLLVARVPSLRAAEKEVDAAAAGVQNVNDQRRELRAQEAAAIAQRNQAREDLGQTNVQLPADHPGALYRVVSVDAALGDQARSGQPIARLYRADALEVPVPLSGDQLAFLDVPPPSTFAGARDAFATQPAAGGGSRAVLRGARQQEVLRWAGRVARVAGEVPTDTRLMRVIVAVTDAGDLSDPLSLLTPGMFVEVEFTGRRLEGVARIPRAALRGSEEGYVWLAVPRRAASSNGAQRDADTKQDDASADEAAYMLRRRAITVAYIDRSHVYVRGLNDGERVILSRLDSFSDGMALHLADPPAQAAAQTQPQADADPREDARDAADLRKRLLEIEGELREIEQELRSAGEER